MQPLSQGRAQGALLQLCLPLAPEILPLLTRVAQVPAVLVYEHPALPKGKCPVTQGRDTWWAEALSGQSTSCAPVWLDAEAPLFLLYTSGKRFRGCDTVWTLCNLQRLMVRSAAGSTGQPKGVVHTTGALRCCARAETAVWASMLVCCSWLHGPGGLLGALCV